MYQTEFTYVRLIQFRPSLPYSTKLLSNIALKWSHLSNHFDLLFNLSKGKVHEFSGEVQKISGEVQNDLRGGAHLPTPPNPATD